MAGKPGTINRRPTKVPEHAKIGHRPQHEATPTSRNLVQFLRVAGYTSADIARIAGIAPDTLRKHYREELDNAKARIDAKMANTLVLQGTGGNGEDAWKNANIAANIFYHKVYMGKNERTMMMHAGAVGIIDLSKFTDEQLEQYQRLLEVALNVGADGGGTPGGGEGGVGSASG